MSVALIGHPGNAEALQALGEWLMDQHYSQHACEAIVGFAAVEGTPTGSPYLDREDEAMATEVFVEALGDVSPTDSAWDEFAAEPGGGPVYLTVESILRAGGLVPPELEEDAEDLDGAEEDGPIGDPRPSYEPEPFEPSADDWSDYQQWARTIEARRLGLLPPIAGGAPSIEEERAEALEFTRLLDDLADQRAAEDRAELRYGWE